MKKIISLLKACMTSDMSLFKISTKNKGKRINRFLPLFIALYLMFVIWGSANSMFEKMSLLHLQVIMLSLIAFATSIMTFMEGIYKSGSLLFNSKDDDLLLSLPIKRRTVLFIRIFKFYVFEVLFNSLFLLPFMIAYIRWAEYLDWSYLLVSIVMLLFLPIIPIILSCIIGSITSSLSSRFKYKNLTQIILSMLFLLLVFYASFNTNSIMEYLMKNATSINDLIIKIYYPAGIYAKLASNFNIIDLLIFILINIGLFIIFIFILGKFYFKINSRMKSITTTSSKSKTNNLVIKRSTPMKSLVKKELNTFFKIPVFIINAGFALVLFIILFVVISIKFVSLIPIITSEEAGFGITKELIFNNLSIFVLILILFASFMTSITNSVISLEGRNISILKSLPIKVKTILMSKVFAALIITTPVLLLGDIILFIKFKLSVIEVILLLLLSIIVPLISHLIGLIVNLKYPRFDWENSTEVVKQSTSSFVAVMIGMLLLIISIVGIINAISFINSLLLLLIVTIIYGLIDILLYIYLVNKGIKIFNSLTI